MTNQQIEQQLSTLQSMIGCENLDVVEDINVRPCMVVWKLWGGTEQLGQLEARFGSEYADEPDGFAAYFEGFNWTDYCSTVEQCAAQHFDRQYA